jgi:hypothetical protein
MMHSCLHLLGSAVIVFVSAVKVVGSPVTVVVPCTSLAQQAVARTSSMRTRFDRDSYSFCGHSDWVSGDSNRA